MDITDFSRGHAARHLFLYNQSIMISGPFTANDPVSAHHVEQEQIPRIPTSSTSIGQFIIENVNLIGPQDRSPNSLILETHLGFYRMILMVGTQEVGQMVLMTKIMVRLM